MLPALSSESEPDCNSPSGVVLSLGFLVKNPGLIGKKVVLVDCSFTAVSCAVTFTLDTEADSVSFSWMFSTSVALELLDVLLLFGGT